MKSLFKTAFDGKQINKNKVMSLANDLYLIHHAFYLFLGISYMRFKNEEYLQILADEIGLSERGRLEKYGPISHADLWLKDLGIERRDLHLLPPYHVAEFQHLCFEASNDKQKGEALLSAIEHIAFEFVSTLGDALQRSGYNELASVDIHCNPEYGIEVHHAQETDKFVDNPYYAQYQEKVTDSFIALATYFN